MTQAKARYTAALQGAEIDLKLLAHCFSTDECRVIVGEQPEIGHGKFYQLSSTKLEMVPSYEKRMTRGCDDKPVEILLDTTWDKAHDEAERLLSVMHGAARLVRSQYKPVSIDSMHKFSLDGQWMGSSTTSSFGDSCSFGDSWRNYPLPPKRTGLTELVRLWTLKGLEDDAVSLALAVYGTQPSSWTMLYMIYEVIKDDIGGNFSKLITANLLHDFTKSANNARHLKDGPRHAFKTDLDEGSLITLRDAEAIVRHLLNHWLGDKVGMIME